MDDLPISIEDSIASIDDSTNQETSSTSVSNGSLQNAHSKAELAAQLLRELRTNPDFLPPYRANVIQQCIEEIQRLHDLNVQDFAQGESGSNDMAIITSYRHGIINRIKRCCCAYVNERLHRLKEIRWRDAGKLTPEVQANISEEELRWFQAYNQALFQYQMDIGDDGINLLTMIHPPKTTLIQVRLFDANAFKHLKVVAKEDYGEFETSDGLSVVIKKERVYSIPRKDCETLVKKGVLEYT
ncbi:DNA replication complex GINS protein PSF1 [Aphelenchoides besseyi]|nr:DNA replication complex GINS protein PSF1 [Aphelenchoides besseyi]